MEKQKYLVLISFSAIVDGGTQPDALHEAALNVQYGFRGSDVKNLNIKVVRKEYVPEVPKAIAEAPFADQVRVEPAPEAQAAPASVSANDIPF